MGDIKKQPWAIDESTLVTETFQVPDGYLPKGIWWDAEGASYKAIEYDPASGSKWRWVPMNKKAVAKGYNGQKLYDFIMPAKPPTGLGGS